MTTMMMMLKVNQYAYVWSNVILFNSYCPDTETDTQTHTDTTAQSGSLSGL